MKAAILAIVAAVVLGGCMSSQPQAVQGIWLRADGQSGKDNPALATQFATDKATCTPPGSAEPNRTCMGGRGYLLVPENQAAAKAAELRANATATAAPATTATPGT